MTSPVADDVAGRNASGRCAAIPCEHPLERWVTHEIAPGRVIVYALCGNCLARSLLHGAEFDK